MTLATRSAILPARGRRGRIAGMLVGPGLSAVLAREYFLDAAVAGSVQLAAAPAG